MVLNLLLKMKLCRPGGRLTFSMLWLRWTPEVIQNTEFQTQALHALTSRQLNGTEYANTKVTEMSLTMEISLEQFVIIH